MRIMRVYLIGLILYFSFSISFAQGPSQNIPDFNFFKSDNSLFTSKDLATGKGALFIFFDVTCSHCQHTIKALNARIKECKGIDIYLITLDKRNHVDPFLKQYGYNLTDAKNVLVLYDLKDQFITHFKPRKYPSVFLYSSQKRLILYSDEDENLDSFLKIIDKKQEHLNLKKSKAIKE